MSESSTTVFDEQCERLLTLARVDGCPVALNELTERLRPSVRQFALQMMKGTRGMKLDFADESLAVVFAPYNVFEKRGGERREPRIFGFDWQEGNFEGWCSKVLSNYCASQQRKKSEVQSLPEVFDVADTEPLDWLRLHELFDDESLNLVTSWPPVDRLMLLCLSGMMVKIGQPLWLEFIEQAEADLGFELPHPFPVRLILDSDDPSSRMSIVAALLGRLTNTLSVQWKRKKHLLRELAIIQQYDPTQS